MIRFNLNTLVLCLALAAPGPAGAVEGCTTNKLAEISRLKANRPSSQTEYEKQLVKLNRELDQCADQTSASVQNCRESADGFTDAVHALSSTCSTLGLAPSNEAGAIGCSFNADQCQCAVKNLSGVEKVALKCHQVDASKLKFCPQVSEQKQEAQDKRREKAEERIDKAKKELRALQDEIVKDQKESKGKEKEARANKDKANEEYAKAVAEAKKEASQKQQELYAQMNEIQKQMVPANQAVTAMGLRTLAADNALTEAKTTIGLNCSRQAVAAINAMQTEAVQAIRSGTYNRGGQNDLFRQVGLTDRQAWQQQADRRRRWCMASEETVRSEESANMVRNATEKQIQVDLAAAKASVAALSQQMAQLQNPAGGCNAVAANGTGMETTACRNQRETAEQVTELARVRDAAIMSAAQEVYEARAEVAESKKSKQDQINELTKEIGEQETTLKNLKGVDEAQSPPAAGGNADQVKALSKAMAQVTDKAVRLDRCCDQSGNRSASAEACRSAKGFLSTHGITVENPPTGTTPPATRPAPAVTGTGSDAGV